MSESQQTEDGAEKSEMTEAEFQEHLLVEGVTLDGLFYMAHGEGNARRYYCYEPSMVKGFDAVREDGQVSMQQVANHEEAVVEQVAKSDIMEKVYPKVADGFGTMGTYVVESNGESDDAPGGPAPEPDYEPLDADELMETIRSNFEEHGFFGTDEEGEEKVVSLAHPDARLMGYITGSHVGALPSEHLSTVDDYRNAVFQALADGDDPLTDELVVPKDVPICTDDMMEVFRNSSNDMDEETRERIAQQVRQRWEDGEYDFLRKDGSGADAEPDGEAGDEDEAEAEAEA
jgi:hypothetical protein